MHDDEFDRTVLTAAFDAIAAQGWLRFSLPACLRAAGVDLARARVRFPCRAAVVLRLGACADRAALADAMSGATLQERLFDALMRRFDVLQAYRAGVLALMRALPADPGTAILLAAATADSMRWVLAAASPAAAEGAIGALRINGLVGVWLWAVRAWRSDETPDLATTMAALDLALARAAQIARSLPGGEAAAPEGADGPQAEAPDLETSLD